MMLSLSLITALTGCATLERDALLRVSAELPDMTFDCDPDMEETEDANSRVYSTVAPNGENCRGKSYARVTAIDWAEYEDDIPNNAKIRWDEFVSALQTLNVTTNLGPVPAGVTVKMEQLVATESGDLGMYEADPMALVDMIGSETIEGSATHLFSLEYAFNGNDPENLVENLQALTVNTTGPIETIQQSFDNDPTLQAVTVAEVNFPLGLLDEDTPTEIYVDVEELLDFVAKVKLSLFGKKDKDDDGDAADSDGE